MHNGYSEETTLADDCKRTLEITVPHEEVQQVKQRVLAELASKAALPGFRPGKVPPSVIQSRFGDQVRQETIDHILSKAFQERAQELELDVVSTPSVKDLKFEENEPLTFTAEFEVRPIFELQSYEGIEVPYAEPTLSDDEVNARLDAMREQRAELVNVDPRPVEDGDFAVVALESLSPVGTDEPIRQDEMNLEVGGQHTLPEFTENVRGMQVGETREFDVTYPDEYGGQNLAGKTIRFQVKLNGLRKRELPELNDEFAQDLGDYKTIDDLREAVQSSLLAEREYMSRERAKEAIIEKFGEQYSFPVPNVFVEQQVESQMRRQLRYLAGQGADISNLQLDWQKVLEEQREPAAKAVRSSLVLDRIADEESVSVTQEELDRELARAAQRERTTVAALREQIEKEGGLGRIAQQIRTEKTLNLLFEKATKVDPPAEPETSSEATAESDDQPEQEHS
jgi:trigger factor